MSYRARSSRRYVKRSKRNFFVTLIIVILLLFATIQWILPTFVNGVGLVTGIFKEKSKTATNIAEIDVKGYSTPGSKVKLFLDGQEIEIIDASSEGDFTFKNVSLGLGINSLYAKSIDSEDRESLPSKTFRITYDNEKPTLNVSEPEDGKTIQGGEKKIKITGNTEVNAEVFVNDAQIIIDKDGNFSSDQNLNDGENIFTIKSVDPASNITEISRRVVYQP